MVAGSRIGIRVDLGGARTAESNDPTDEVRFKSTQTELWLLNFSADVGEELEFRSPYPERVRDVGALRNG